VEHYLRQIAEALTLHGSINVQLKMTRNGPVAFEINPRFSSTVVFRHLLGFHDFIWAMKDLKGIDLGPYQTIKAGVRFYRGPREFIVQP
jgi:carbamoyl-phosphate synthase large subunit